MFPASNSRFKLGGSSQYLHVFCRVRNLQTFVTKEVKDIVSKFQKLNIKPTLNLIHIITENSFFIHLLLCAKFFNLSTTVSAVLQLST